MRSLSPYQRARILLLAACLACISLVWWGAAWVGLPLHPGYEDGLLLQPSPALAMVEVAVLFVLSLAVGTALAGMIRFNAGLFAAAVGLGALSARAGNSRDSIFWGLSHAGAGSAILSMLGDMIYLTVIVIACGAAINYLYGKKMIRDRLSGEPEEPVEAPALSIISSLAFQAVITAILILFLARTEAKQQCWAAIGIASLVGVAVAESFVPTPRPSWCFVPPLLVGILGYVLAYFDPAGAAIGHLTGSGAELARPLPLDYAAAGPAGALLGLWMARAWARERQQSEAVAEA